MNKTLTILIIAGLIGAAYSAACDSSCQVTGATCDTSTTPGTCTACPSGKNIGKSSSTNTINDACVVGCHSSCTGVCTTACTGNIGPNLGACDSVATNPSATCGSCTAAAGYVATVGGLTSDGCSNTCDTSCSTANGGTCTSGICSGCTVGKYKPGTVKYSSSYSNYDGCVAYATAVPTVDSPSSAYNVTPVQVFTSTDIASPSAFAYAANYIEYTGGFDDQNYYAWSVITTGTTVALNRRTLSANFTKGNSSDVAISTTITPAQWQTECSGNGYFGMVSQTVQNWGSTSTTNVWTATELYFSYVSVNGTSASTPKALTGNTDKNVVLDVQQCWYDNGIFYIAWVKSTHVQGVSYVAAAGSTAAVNAAAETWTLNGLYIQGVNVTDGSLFYTNSTGGVQSIALTASKTGTCGGATCTQTSTTVDSVSSAPDVSFMFGGQNYTNNNESTVSYLMTDNTATTGLYSLKYGTITMATGVGSAGTTLVTKPADTATSATASTTTPYSYTDYSPAGFLGSAGTYGVFILKKVYTQTTTTANSGTTVYSILGYYNGSSTASANVTLASGYGSTMIQGFGTSDGFVLMELQTSTTTPTSAPTVPPKLLQAERFFTNGSADGTAVSLGTYQSTLQLFQDANGSIIVGWYSEDSANSPGVAYQGYMGKYLYQQMAAATSLTSIIGLLSLLIVALFAF